MLKANFCNHSNTQVRSSTHSFLPGENVTITWSVPSVSMIWTSPQLYNYPIHVNSALGFTHFTKFDGAIVFDLDDVIMSNSSICTTATATIENIQESMQGLSFTCISGLTIWTTVVIDVVGKLYAVPKTMLNL